MGREENGNENCEAPQEDGTARSVCAVSVWYFHGLIPSIAY
jgi:hypothetical protein